MRTAVGRLCQTAVFVFPKKADQLRVKFFSVVIVFRRIYNGELVSITKGLSCHDSRMCQSSDIVFFVLLLSKEKIFNLAYGEVLMKETRMDYKSKYI